MKTGTRLGAYEIASALNHPHIAQIYGIEDRALAMELIECS